MRWLVPKSLIGQIALVMAAALLAAQAINFSLIFTERIRVSRAQIEGPAINRFILFAQRLESAAPGSVRHWVVPAAGHTAALDVAPREWERRVVRFLDEAVGRRTGG